MIPLKADGVRVSFPLFTLTIIAINIGVFLYQRFFGPQSFEFYVFRYGLIPASFTGQVPTQLPIELASPLGPLSMFSSMFMHGGFGHIISNLWFLWIFGDTIEQAFGKIRFLVFYLLMGTLASLAHIATSPSAAIPLVGASGAIAGVLGAYFILFPHHRVLTLVPIVFYITIIRIPAVLFLGFWFLMQLLYSTMGGNVAWWAHIGGFVAGILLARVFLPKRK